MTRTISNHVVMLFVIMVACSVPPERQEVVILGVTQANSTIQPGRRLPAEAIVALDADEHISFFDASGRLHSLSGPYQGPIRSAVELPVATSAGEQLLASVSKYLERTDQTKQALGATRTPIGYNPWTFPVLSLKERSVICVPSTGSVLFTRPVSMSATPSEFKLRAENGQAMSVLFGSGKAFATIPVKSITDRTYVVEIGDKTIESVQIVEIPATEESFLPLRLHQGQCTHQFESLISAAARSGSSD